VPGGAPTTPEPAPGRPVITPAQAATVLAAFWAVHAQAVVAGDLAALRRLDTGPAATWETGALSCGCLLRAPLTLVAARYFVPRQTHYPAYFVTEAEEGYEGQRGAAVLVFTKAAAEQPWLVAEHSAYDVGAGQGLALGVPVTGPGGYVAAPTPAQHQVAVTAAAQLAATWQAAKDSGSVPGGSEFLIAGDLAERLRQITAFRQGAVQVNGAIGVYRFYASATDPLAEVGIGGGYALACQAVRETVVYRPRTASGALVQDQARGNWGQLLPPGVYPSLTSRDAWQTCFVIAPQPTRPILVIDQSSGGSVPSAR